MFHLVNSVKFVIGSRAWWTVLTLMMLTPSLVLAHSLFIQSGRYHVSSGKGSPLFFCYGHHFPVDDAVRRKKLTYVKVIDPENIETQISLRDEKSLHSYIVDYSKSGTYVLVAETKPGLFAMYTDEKGRKRHSFKPLSTFAGTAQSIESSMRSSQWAKSYVVCDEPSKSFPAQIGLPLELVPEQDPSTLKRGDSLTFMVSYDGKPYQGEGFWDATYSGFSTEAEDMYIQRSAVAGGKFTLPIDASGRWFVRFFTKNGSDEGDRANFLIEKRTTTLTFEVRNERRRPKVESD